MEAIKSISEGISKAVSKDALPKTTENGNFENPIKDSPLQPAGVDNLAADISDVANTAPSGLDRLKNISEKLPNKENVMKGLQVATNLVKELQGDNPDVAGVFSNFPKEVKDKMSDDTEKNDQEDGNEKSKIESKFLSPGMDRFKKLSDNLPNKEKALKGLQASANLVKELQGENPDVAGAFSNFAAEVKGKTSGDTEKNIETDDVSGQSQDDVIFSGRKFFDVATKLLKKRAKDAEGQNEEDEDSTKKHFCTKARIFAIVISLLSYIAVAVLYYFHFRSRLDVGRSQLVSCASIKRFPTVEVLRSGIYELKDSDGASYQTYCDMTTDGGGWTLVASVHDNNPTATGRCTTGDRWSSDQGNNYPRGGAAWSNFITFGRVESATSDDYKNPGFFDIHASDVMIWQVPNDVNIDEWQQSSHLRYYTRDGFLNLYGGNLFQLFRGNYTLTGSYTFPEDNGPSSEVHVDYGNSSLLVSQLGKSLQGAVEPGYIQFRVVDIDGNKFAFCPGVRVNNLRYPQYACIGSTGINSNPNYCGDFASLWWEDARDIFGAKTEFWKAEKSFYESTFLIFYR